MKHDGFPWTQAGAGPEPQLPADFSSRVIEQVRTTRTRNRRAKSGACATAGSAAIIAAVLWMRASATNQPTLAPVALVASDPIANYDTTPSSDQSDPDLLTVLMPSARPAQRFDAYYGTAGWDSYANWNPATYDWSRTR